MKQTQFIIYSFILIAIIAAFIVITIGESPVENIYVDLSKKENLTDTNSEDALKIGVAAMISPKETLVVYQEIVDYIGRELGQPVKLVQRKTYAEMNELVKNKEVIAAFVCSGPYVDGHEEFGMELIAAPEMYNKTSYYSYIIVPKNSTTKSFEDLRGKTFAFTDPNSNTGTAVPKYVLAKMNETPDTFFKKYMFTGSHDNSIEAVSENIVDGAAIDHLIWEYINKRNPGFTSGTRILDKLGPYCMPPIVTHPDTAPVLKEKLRSILLNMDKNDLGKKIIAQIEINRFVMVNNSCYDDVRKMKEWEEKQ